MPANSNQGRNLDQYHISARSQLRVGHKAANWVGFATAAGAALAMSHVAEATVIYSGAQNLTIALVDPNAANEIKSANIDLDGDGNVDVVVNVQHHPLSAAIATATASVANFGSGGFIQGAPGATFPAISGFTANSFSFARKLSSGASIGPVGAFTGGTSNHIAQGQFGVAGFTTNGSFSGSSVANPGTWNLSSTGFAGVRFKRAGNDHFAWIRLHFADTSNNGLADTATIIDWAWSDFAGGPIQAGSTPEPAPLALLAAGAVGIASFRRKKKAATVEA